MVVSGRGCLSMSDLLGEKSSLAVIIAVGSELLTPDKIDTNSLFLTEELNGIGFTVTQKIVVGLSLIHI